MSENVFMRIFAEIDEAKEIVAEAMQIARDKRGEALEDNALMYARAFKEIEFLLKRVLEE
jgi:hypothetical protein